MKITSCLVVLTDTMDHVFFDTDFPSPLFKEERLTLPYNTGIDYVRKEFGIEPTVKDSRIY